MNDMTEARACVECRRTAPKEGRVRYPLFATEKREPKRR